MSLNPSLCCDAGVVPGVEPTWCVVGVVVTGVRPVWCVVAVVVSGVGLAWKVAGVVCGRVGGVVGSRLLLGWWCFVCVSWGFVVVVGCV